MTRRRIQPSFILCIDEAGCDDLQKGKVYRVLADAKAAREGFVRVIDESGEDYLYPEVRFVAIDIPPAALDALVTSARS